MYVSKCKGTYTHATHEEHLSILHVGNIYQCHTWGTYTIVKREAHILMSKNIYRQCHTCQIYTHATREEHIPMSQSENIYRCHTCRSYTILKRKTLILMSKNIYQCHIPNIYPWHTWGTYINFIREEHIPISNVRT